MCDNVGQVSNVGQGKRVAKRKIDKHKELVGAKETNNCLSKCWFLIGLSGYKFIFVHNAQ